MKWHGRPIRYLEVTRAKDITYAYFRRDGKRQARLPLPIGTPEFWEAYQAAAKGQDVVAALAKTRAKSGSLQVALDEYLVSPQFLALRDTTRARQVSTLNKWRAADGDKPLALLDEEYIDAGLAAIVLPNPRRTWLITVREFCKWAKLRKLIPVDPTAGKIVKLPKAEPHCLTEEEIAQYFARWHLGTQQHLLFALLLYTGQRCSDVRRLGRQHIRDGKFVIKQQKTGTEVRVPAPPALQAAIDAYPNEHLTYLVKANGKPFSQKDINSMFRRACNEAGLSTDCVPHGLRHAFCRRLADLGIPPQDIAALSGHLTLAMVLHYTKAYDRGVSGERSMAKLIAAGMA